METKSYKILGLQISNLRKITAAELKFAEKGMTQIVGMNDQGKSTIIDAIEILLKGFKHVEKDMITHGQEKAEVIAKIGRFTVKRVITEKSNRLEINDEEGFTMSRSPQSFLDALVNEFTFNPQPFLDKTPEMKLKFVLDLLGMDFSKENEEILKLDEERKFVNRSIKEFGIPTEPEKVERVDVDDIYKRKAELEKRSKIEGNKEAIINYFEKKLSSLDCDGAKIIEEFLPDPKNCPSWFKQKYEGICDVIKEIARVIEGLDKPQNFEVEYLELETELKTASDRNLKAAAYENYIDRAKQLEEKKQSYKKLTEKINKIRFGKIKRVSEAKMPLKELKLTEEGLYYKDIFCENWAKSLGYKIALTLCAAMQPKLRAIFLDNGEAMDRDVRNELDNWAVANDIQIILTVVSGIPEKKEEGVFYIEEGQLSTGN